MTLAENGGFTETQAALSRGPSEERAMADWIESNPPDVTLRFAQLSEAGEQASH